ncbi:hypothetical protein RND81_11G065300 [Saponaria officinalis]|uniref:B box-type domain-containing protein n=1 Tax=Saponaria officinalis TaxID=3572 RepID=A0AAW1HIN8_SAPOF
MEKTCEFCAAPRPIIYCQADGAFLCLSCDSKVHSANALSSRHTRTLLCDSCRYNQANVRCLDHLMLLCKGCDARMHRLSPQHKKLTISSFSGCPSAKNFAALWGFGVNELNDFSARGQHGPDSSMEDTSSFVSAEHESCSSGQYYKEPINHHKEQNNYLIMQQILDLKKLQFTDESEQSSPLLRRYDEVVTPSATHSTSGKLNEGLNSELQENPCTVSNPQNLDGSNKASKGDRFTSSSQLDNLSGSPSVGDPFWPSRSPADPNQIWSQNIQDLGVCEEAEYSDVFNIPDVDVTFRNFEDFFTGDVGLAESLLGDDDLMWSEIEKAANEEISAYSSVDVSKKGEHTRYETPNQLSQSMRNSYHLIRSSGSPSFSPSRLSAESSGSECLDSGNSGSMSESYGTEIEGGEPSIRSSKERKKTRMHDKQSPLSPRKSKADTHKRIKSRCIKVEGYESDAANVTKSY